jgi:hypothetical protein
MSPAVCLPAKKINREKSIQLKHPAGKKTISMDKSKYETIRKVLLDCLKTKGESTHAEILKTLTQYFKKNKTKFEGSVEWYMEWVKLDLEARKEIKRIRDKSLIKFAVIR